MGQLRARTGETRTGLPVSLNVPAPPDIERHVARFYVTIMDQPDDRVVEDMLLNETGMVRVLVRGEWDAWVPPRGWKRFEGAVLCGAQRAAVRVRVRGPIATAGFTIRPGGWFGIDPRPHDKLADRLEMLEGEWGEAMVAACGDIDDHARTVDRMVAAVGARVAALAAAPDPLMEEMERIARADPTTTVRALADRLGLTQRVLDARACAHFGHTPKVVLRRSRFLDMAAVMRGLAVPDEEELASLRFYDASHLNKEFRLFVGMTPARFHRAVTPLLTPGLEVRQQRKLHDIGLSPAPWLADGSNGHPAR